MRCWIDNIITNHHHVVLALFSAGLIAEIVFFKIESRQMMVFLVLFLATVSVFFAENGKDSRPSGKSSKCVTEKPERSPTQCGTQDISDKLATDNEYGQGYSKGNDPSPHTGSIAGDEMISQSQITRGGRYQSIRGRTP